MSNGTSDPQVPPLNEEQDDDDPYEVLSASDAGVESGGWWAGGDIGEIERRSFWAIITGSRPSPQFSNCADVDEVIREIVRAVHPPSGMHADSARAYWELIHGEYLDSRPFAESFFSSALATVEYAVLDSVDDCAREWVEQRYHAENLDSVRQFVEQHGDTWQNEYPEGCSSVFEVALYMAGELESSRSQDAALAFRREFGLLTNCVAGTESYARLLIEEIVTRIRDWSPAADAHVADEEGSAHAADDPPADPRSRPPYRHLRGIRLRPRTDPSEQDSEVTPPPLDAENDD